MLLRHCLGYGTQPLYLGAECCVHETVSTLSLLELGCVQGEEINTRDIRSWDQWRIRAPVLRYFPRTKEHELLELQLRKY